MNYNQHTLSKSRNHEWNNFIRLFSREVMTSQHKPTLSNSNNFIHKASMIHKTHGQVRYEIFIKAIFFLFIHSNISW